MFGTKIDNEITMAQRLVALFRDVILGVVILITCIIVYFGGDSSKLNVLDWTKLVGSAAFIVVAPVVVFFGIKLYAKLIRVVSQPYFYFIYGTHIPKTLYAWMFLKLFRMTKRGYVSFWRRQREPMENFEISHPIIHKALLAVIRTTNSVDRWTSKWYPYFLALMSLGLGVEVFRQVIVRYIP